MKKTITILISFTLVIIVNAQNPEYNSPRVIASTGHYYSSTPPGGLEVSYTVGEMTAVTTEGLLSGVHATQGFHQPEEMVVDGLNEQNEVPLNFVLYPNPSDNSIWVGYEMQEKGNALITICDLNGKTITTLNQETYTSGKNVEHFDISQLSAGSYLLTLQFTTTQGKHFLSAKQFLKK